jgi:hypothetical protein
MAEPGWGFLVGLLAAFSRQGTAKQGGQREGPGQPGHRTPWFFITTPDGSPNRWPILPPIP